MSQHEGFKPLKSLFFDRLVRVKPDDIVYTNKVTSGRQVNIPSKQARKEGIHKGDLVEVYARPILRENRLRDRGDKLLFFDSTEGIITTRRVINQKRITLPHTEFRIADFEVGDKVKVLVRKVANHD